MDALNRLLFDGIGPIHAAGHLVLYRVLLGTVVLAVALACSRAIRVRELAPGRRGRDLGQLSALVLQVPALYAVWLAYGQGQSLAALALPPLVWSWLLPLPGIGPNIPLRLVLSLLGPYSPVEQVTNNTVGKRLRHTIFDCSVLVSLGTVGLTHALPTPYAGIVVIFGMCIAAEGIVANFLGEQGYLGGLVIAPALLIVGVVGASNLFVGFTHNPALDGVVWIQATTACASYSFVQFFVVRTERNLQDYLRQRSFWRMLGVRLAVTLDIPTQDVDAQQVAAQLDATSHRLNGLSALAFLLVVLGLHFVLSDAARLTAVVASAIPLVGALIVGGMLKYLRRWLNKIVMGAVQDGHITESDSQQRIEPVLAGARAALRRSVMVMLAGYVVVSLVLGLTPLAQSDGETVLDFFDATGADNLLRTTATAGHLLADGQFWLQALRTLTSAALLLTAVAALRFYTAVRANRRQFGQAPVQRTAAVAVGATQR
jgi:hypothetical protein